jgi:Zn-dependent peptidase ImmA (M78 family)
MRWAREKAGFDIPTAASKLQRPESDVKGWEKGTLQPTLAQARMAARLYKRSLAVLYLPEPPKDFDTLRDFRHLTAGYPRDYSPELALLIRQVISRQEWLREYYISEGAKKVTFIGSHSVTTSPQVLAKSIRELLDISIEEQMACSSPREALNLWIEKAENVSINICRQGKIECEEARGFALSDEYAPFVYINSNDAVVAQLFTLVHELTHLWIDQPGISNLEGLRARSRTSEAAIEIFCNKIAAETLIDQKIFDQLWFSGGSNQTLNEKIEYVSGMFRVSEEVVARRLLDRSQITLQQYQQLRKYYLDRWLEYKKQERERSSGGPSYYIMKVVGNGRTFTQVVISAYENGFIMGRDASSLLGVKLNHLSKLADFATAS